MLLGLLTTEQSRLSDEDSTRHRLRGDTEQGLDFVYQRIYAIGLVQRFEVLQDDMLTPLSWADCLAVPMQIDATRFFLLSEKHERVGAADVEHW